MCPLPVVVVRGAPALIQAAVSAHAESERTATRCGCSRPGLSRGRGCWHAEGHAKAGGSACRRWRSHVGPLRPVDRPRLEPRSARRCSEPRQAWREGTRRRRCHAALAGAANPNVAVEHGLLQIDWRPPVVLQPVDHELVAGLAESLRPLKMIETFEIDHAGSQRSRDALITNAWPLLVTSPGLHQDRDLQATELEMPIEAREVVPERSAAGSDPLFTVRGRDPRRSRRTQGVEGTNIPALARGVAWATAQAIAPSRE